MRYQAPEVLASTPYVPRCADIYSAGVTLFHLLTKAFPCHIKAVSTDQYYKYIYKKEHQTFWQTQMDEHGHIIERMSDSVVNLIENMIAYDPKLRPTAKDVL